jgi:glucokinase
MQVFAGFDLGGTQLKYGLVDSRGQILLEQKAATPSTIEGLLHLLKNIWEDLKRREKKRIRAVGFGFPGIYSLKKRRILQSPNYKELDNFELSPALSQFIEVPFWVNNDANLAAFGEFKCAAGKGVQSLIFLTIGTGVGSGIILDAKLWMGKCGYGGELGHMIVNPEGERCNCGGKGCLETEVSASKIVKKYNALRKAKENISSEEVFLRAKKGDEHARRAFAQAGYYLGIGLGTIINFLNPEKILIGGAVMAAGNLLLLPAIEEARKRAFKASFECCQIKKATLGNKAGFIGAAMWAKDQLEKSG